MRKPRAAQGPELLTNADWQRLETQQSRVAEVHARLLKHVNAAGADFERERGAVIDQADRLILERGGRLLKGDAPVADMPVADLWTIVAYAGRHHPTWR